MEYLGIFEAQPLYDFGVKIHLDAFNSFDTERVNLTFSLQNGSIGEYVISGLENEDKAQELVDYGFTIILYKEIFGTVEKLPQQQITIDCEVIFVGDVSATASDIYNIITGDLINETSFYPTFDVVMSDDKSSIILKDNSNKWPGVINMPFSITVKSYAPEISVDIDETLSMEDLELSTGDVRDGFEFTIPISLLSSELSLIPDSVYNISINFLEDDEVIASSERKEVLYGNVSDFVSQKAMSLNVHYPVYDKSLEVVTLYAYLIAIITAADYDDDGKVVEVLAKLNEIIQSND